MTTSTVDLLGRQRLATEDLSGRGDAPVTGQKSSAGSWAIGALVLVGIIAPAVLALATHSFGIPRNDDWAYRRVLTELVRTGHLSFDGWGAMTLVGQVFWAAPFELLFGSHTWVPGFAVGVLATGGLGAAYLLARSMLMPGRAFVCCLLLVAFPGFALNTTSFMTDVPTFSAETVCLAFGAVALRAQSGLSDRAPGPWLAMSLAAGAVGFSIREFSLAAPMAVLVALALGGRRQFYRSVVSLAALLTACGALYLWTTHLPGAQHDTLAIPGLNSAHLVVTAYFTLALMVSPLLVPAALRARAFAGRGALAAGALSLLAGAALLVGGQSLLLGNYWAKQGALGAAVMLGGRPALFAWPAWSLLQVLTLLSGTALAALLFIQARRLFAAGRGRLARPKQCDGGVGAMIKVFALLNGAGLVLFGLFVRASLFDRYLWGAAFATLLLLARKPKIVPRGLGHDRRPAGQVLPPGALDASRSSEARGRPGPYIAGALLGAVLALTSTAVTLNADSYDAASWAIGQSAVHAGYRPSQVDAGFEWVGAHAVPGALRGRQVQGARFYETWYAQMFPGFVDCAVVSGAPLPGPALRLVHVARYRELYFAGGEEPLYLYAVQSPFCRSVRRAAE